MTDVEIEFASTVEATFVYNGASGTRRPNPPKKISRALRAVVLEVSARGP
jgi:hypothetical protein